MASFAERCRRLHFDLACWVGCSCLDVSALQMYQLEGSGYSAVAGEVLFGLVLGRMVVQAEDFWILDRVARKRVLGHSPCWRYSADPGAGSTQKPGLAPGSAFQQSVPLYCEAT